jgi:DNA-binding XRE family transcriptional regulator
MSTRYTPWNEVKAKVRALDPRTDQEINSAQTTAHERLDAMAVGHQFAETRHTVGTTQAELAQALGVTQARISKIEHGEISCIDIVRAYVAALGGTVSLTASLGDRSWKVA